MPARDLPRGHRLHATASGLADVVRHHSQRDSHQQPAILRWPRLAVTALDPDQGDYPDSIANTYWIKFLDGDFDDMDDGNRLLTVAERQQEARAVCHNIVPGVYIPLGTRISVWRQNERFWTQYAAGGLQLVEIEPGGSSGAAGSAPSDGTPIWPDATLNMWSCRLVGFNAQTLAFTASGTSAWAKVIDLDPTVPSIVPLLAGDRFQGMSVGVHTDQFDFSRPVYAIRRERRDFRFEVTSAISTGGSGAGRIIYWDGSDEVMIGDVFTLIAGFDTFHAKVGDIVWAEFDPARGEYIAMIVECD